MTLNPLTVLVRKDICATCPHQCPAYLAGQVDFEDAKASCPVKWLSAWKPVQLSQDMPVHPTARLIRRVEPTEEKGRLAWRWLHTEALKGALTPDRLKFEFFPMIPRYGCGCVQGWVETITTNQFRDKDQFAWSVEVHNTVNCKIDKPVVSIDDARAVWEVDSSASA